ncbi:Na+/H+ antiporter subunit E [Candidatus Bipolaricaulota bacterium]|nr:Na+/H+ antiporter subunit E [Candidatus Bipolaricaulota bacterium]TFH06917.1 MAG: hypothetical protein E4H08_10335 [Candidatus Atribacteria bacterium]
MLLGTAVLWLVWLAITRTLSLLVMLAGLACSLAVVLFWRKLMPEIPASMSVLVRHPLRLIRFAWVLLVRFAHSTLRTSWIILKGKEEGRIMALPIRVTDPLARFILLNSITLTPSTISLLVEDDLLYIHWLQASGGQGDWREIKESLETRLQELFEGGSSVDR